MRFAKTTAGASPRDDTFSFCTAARPAAMHVVIRSARSHRTARSNPLDRPIPSPDSRPIAWRRTILERPPKRTFAGEPDHASFLPPPTRWPDAAGLVARRGWLGRHAGGHADQRRQDQRERDPRHRRCLRRGLQSRYAADVAALWSADGTLSDEQGESVKVVPPSRPSTPSCSSNTRA